MKKEKKSLMGKFYSLLVLAIFLSSSNAIAAGNSYEPKEKVPLWGEFLEGTVDPATYFLGTFVQNLLFISSSTKEILKLSKTIYGNFGEFLLLNPLFSDSRILAITSYLIAIIEPVYVTAIILIGIYLMFISNSPLGRAKAKSYLLKLLLSMILVSVSPAILQMMMSISNGLSQSILSLAPSNFLEMHEGTVANFARMTQIAGMGNVNLGVLFIVLSNFLAIGAFIFLIARYFLVVILGFLLPVSIFLFGFSLTRNVGKALLAMLFFWVFLPVSFSVTLVAVAVGENMLHSTLYEFSAFGIAGTMLLIFSPIGMFYATGYLQGILMKFSDALYKFQGRIIPELSDKISDSEVEAMLRELADRKRRLALEKLKSRKNLYMQLDEEARKKELSLQEYLADMYGVNLVEKKEAYQAHPTIITPVKPLEKKDPDLKEVTVVMGLKVKPVEVEIEVEREESARFRLIMENLTPLIMHNLNLLEQELSENNMFVDFSANKFDLQAGETKTVTVTVAVMEDAQIRTYEGTINVTTMEGFKNFVEVKVNVVPKEGTLPKTTEEACGCLEDIANADGEVSLAKMMENAEFYEYLKSKADEEEKTIEQFVLDECKLKIMGKERDEDRLLTPAVEKPGVKEAEKPSEKEEKTKFGRYSSASEMSDDDRKRFAEEKFFILAPPAPKAKTKIAKT